MTILRFPERRGHFGRILLEYFLQPAGLTCEDLAELAELPLRTVECLLAGQQAVTPAIAQALERALEAPAAFWQALEADRGPSTPRAVSRSDLP